MHLKHFKQGSRMNHFALLTFLIFSSGCAALEQMRCASHNEAETQPFPENQLTECLSTNTFWANHPVFCIGSDNTKPPVMLLHELPGLSAKTLHYAQELASHFSVYVPLFFGTPNQSSALMGGLTVRLNGEWTARPELDGDSRIIKWLQHVTRQVQQKHPNQSIGVIGNCMTGAIPLALFDNPAVSAVVLAQPTLPLPLFYYSHEDEYSLDLSQHALASAIARKDAWIYHLRFETDCVSKRAKKATLKALFDERLIDGEINKDEYAPQCQGKDLNVHSTLIGEYDAGGLISKASQNRRNRVKQFLKDPVSFSRQGKSDSCNQQ
jgi:dienelactone hydrolase